MPEPKVGNASRGGDITSIILVDGMVDHEATLSETAMHLLGGQR